jgi:DNA-binding XRE family transcriptional regulator
MSAPVIGKDPDNPVALARIQAGITQEDLAKD